MYLPRNIAGNNLLGLDLGWVWIWGRFSIEFGGIFMHFNLLSPERIHWRGGVEPGSSPKCPHVSDP